jgi:hypothetical protein
MFDEEAYRQKHNIQHKPAKAHHPMDLSDMVMPVPESERPKKKSKPVPLSPEEIGRQMDEKIKKMMEQEASSRASIQIAEVLPKKTLSHNELNDKSKLIQNFLGIK